MQVLNNVIKCIKWKNYNNIPANVYLFYNLIDLGLYSYPNLHYFPDKSKFYGINCSSNPTHSPDSHTLEKINVSKYWIFIIWNSLHSMQIIIIFVAGFFFWLKQKASLFYK